MHRKAWTGLSVLLLSIGGSLSCGRTELLGRPELPDDPNAITDGGDGSADMGGADTDDGTDGCEGEPAVEQCGNGLDEDCDGVADDGCFCDYTNKSAGVCGNGTISGDDGSCTMPELFESDESSCDGRDNDCDGMTDEGCTCDAGETQPCYSGPPGTENVGICTPGELQCQDGTFGGECVGEVPPEDETCNQLDDDCDGVVDEGCSCSFDDTDEGVCGEALIDEFGNCIAPSSYQEDELTCDGLDNDCDGITDENCPCNFADLAAGVCANSSVSETDGECVEPAGYEDSERSCDGKDNDCDGATDEDCDCDPGESQTCYDGPDGTEGVGACELGVQVCGDDGFFGGACEGQTTPTAESCNGADDDCDGVTDEGCACNYDGSGTGVCADGVIDSEGTCIAPPSYMSDENLCDGLDNDCDGAVDEGCDCNYNETTRGVCSDGVIGENGNCNAPAEYEDDETTCDGFNNDCDGGTDEGCPCDFRNVGEGICSQATRNNGGQCTPPRGFMGREGNCNDGSDNDCDGLVDCDDDDCAQRGQCR